MREAHLLRQELLRTTAHFRQTFREIRLANAVRVGQRGELRMYLFLWCRLILKNYYATYSNTGVIVNF